MAAVPMCVSLVRPITFSHYSGLFKRLPLSSCSQKFSSVTNPVSTTSEAAKTADDSPKDTVDVELTSQLDKVKKENQALNQKVAELDDKYKRALAENENVRQRMQRQITDAKQFGIQGFCKDLLEVADILQRATETVPSDQLNANQNPHLKSLYDGLCMTETQLQKIFRRHGLTQINPIDEKFNPNLHEALFEQAVEGKEPGTVVVVTKIGYMLHERTIRPAVVGVVKAKASS